MRPPPAPRPAVSIAVGTLLVALSGVVAWRIAAPKGESSTLPRRIATLSTTDGPASDDASSETAALAALPDRALAATLRIDLFPPPPPAPETPTARPEPPPRLDVELVAILTTAADRAGDDAEPIRRAFLYDAATQTYATLGVGDALREGVTVAAIDDESATFTIAHGDSLRTLRMELKP